MQYDAFILYFHEHVVSRHGTVPVPYNCLRLFTFCYYTILSSSFCFFQVAEGGDHYSIKNIKQQLNNQFSGSHFSVHFFQKQTEKWLSENRSSVLCMTNLFGRTRIFRGVNVYGLRREICTKEVQYLPQVVNKKINYIVLVKNLNVIYG